MVFASAKTILSSGSFVGPREHGGRPEPTSRNLVLWWIGEAGIFPASAAIPVKPAAPSESRGKRELPPPSVWLKSSYWATSLTCVAKYQVFPNGSVTAELRSP